MWDIEVIRLLYYLPMERMGKKEKKSEWMTTKEKMFCVDMILRDIRWNWIQPLRRVNKAYDLCKELWWDFLELAKEIKERDFEDWRYFRDTFPHWYNWIPHWFSRTFRDKSEECRNVLSDYLTYPFFDDC
jgi:hypothetical protein